jgi:hypothetical protein
VGLGLYRRIDFTTRLPYIWKNISKIAFALQKPELQISPKQELMDVNSM